MGIAEEYKKIVIDGQPPFARHLGIRVVSASPEEVVAEMPVTEALINRNGVLHGGALMSLADNTGGTATFLHLARDEFTTTSESKTNFFRSLEFGDTARAVARLLHNGRTTKVWQTSIYRGDGKLAAQVTQTQMILKRGARG